MDGHYSHVPYTCGWVDHLPYELLCHHWARIWRHSSSLWHRLLSPFWGCERPVRSRLARILAGVEESKECCTIFTCWEFQAATHHYSSSDHPEGEMLPSDLTGYYLVLWDWSWGQHCTPQSSSWSRSSGHIWLGFCSTLLSILQTRHCLQRSCHHVWILACFACRFFSPFSSFSSLASFPFADVFLFRSGVLRLDSFEALVLLASIGVFHWCRDGALLAFLAPDTAYRLIESSWTPWSGTW